MKNDVAFRNSYKEVDTVKLSLDDYDTYQRMRPRHSFNSRYSTVVRMRVMQLLFLWMISDLVSVPAIKILEHMAEKLKN
jgi:hypothetical protein